MKRLSYLLVAFIVLLSTPMFGGEDSKGPSINFRAQLQEANIVVTYQIPNGYYTYLASPYASPLTIKVADNHYFSCGETVFPAGSRKGDEIILSGSGIIKIPLINEGSRNLPSGITLKLEVSYQVCYASQGICYSPVQKTLSFKLKQIKEENKDSDYYEKNGNDTKNDENSDDGLYLGKNSGELIKSKVEGYGFRPLSHKRMKITVHNRVRITLKGRVGSRVYCSTYYRNHDKWYYLRSPRKIEAFTKDGKHTVELFLPEANEYMVSFKGRPNKSLKYKTLFSYNVTATAGFTERDIPVMPIAQFHRDGFKLISHKKAYINARNKVVIKIKGHKNSWLYAYLRDEKYKTYYSPWQTKQINKDGTTSFILTFPKTGKYTLSISGRKNAKDKKSHHYLTYKINCTQAYSKISMPVQINKDFTELGFTRSRLSHPKYYVSTGRNVKIVLRGKPGLAIKAYYSKSKPWKLYEYSPRIFVTPRQGEYTVQAYFPKAGKYNLSIKVDVTKKGDKYKKYSQIARYKITANGGYGDRALDIKMGNYISEDRYKIKPKKGKVVFGSGGDLLWVKDMKEAERISRTQSKIMLILHSASWCGYCKKLKKETFRDPAVVSYARSRFVAIEVGSSTIKNMALYKAKYKKHRSGIPSVSFIAPDGKHLLTRTGYSSGSYYLKVLKNVVAMKDGLVARYERLHKQGLTSYSHKLIKLYQSLGKKYKAGKVIEDLIKSDAINKNDLPKYYLQVSQATWGENKKNYLNKVINGYSYKIGYYWYSAVSAMGINLYGRGYGGSKEETLNKNEKAAISFLQKYAGRKYYSPMWQSTYNNLIQNIKIHAAKKRKKKGWAKY